MLSQRIIFLSTKTHRKVKIEQIVSILPTLYVEHPSLSDCFFLFDWLIWNLFSVSLWQTNKMKIHFVNNHFSFFFFSTWISCIYPTSTNAQPLPLSTSPIWVLHLIQLIVLHWCIIITNVHSYIRIYSWCCPFCESEQCIMT